MIAVAHPDRDTVSRPHNMPPSALDTAFEELAVGFLANYPGLRWEWRDIPSRWWGDRRDLVCAPGQPTEVFASLLGRQIVVGATGREHEDFEDFGRGMSDQEVAREAFEYFVETLTQAGHCSPRQRPHSADQ